MFQWNLKLYMDEKVMKKPMRYRRVIERKKIVKECYCITLAVNKANCLDIYSSRELWFQYYRKKKMQIVGLAASFEGASEILCEMVSDIYKQYGDVNAQYIQNFFEVKAAG